MWRTRKCLKTENKKEDIIIIMVLLLSPCVYVLFYLWGNIFRVFIDIKYYYIAERRYDWSINENAWKNINLNFSFALGRPLHRVHNMYFSFIFISHYGRVTRSLLGLRLFSSWLRLSTDSALVKMYRMCLSKATTLTQILKILVIRIVENQWWWPW